MSLIIRHTIRLFDEIAIVPRFRENWIIVIFFDVRIDHRNQNASLQKNLIISIVLIFNLGFQFFDHFQWCGEFNGVPGEIFLPIRVLNVQP